MYIWFCEPQIPASGGGKPLLVFMLKYDHQDGLCHIHWSDITYEAAKGELSDVSSTNTLVL